MRPAWQAAPLPTVVRTAAVVLAAVWTAPVAAAPQDTVQARTTSMNMSMPTDSVRGSGDMIMTGLRNPMLPGLRGVSPSVDPFLPGQGVDTASLEWAVPGEVVRIADGDTVALEARIVKRRIGGRVFVMYGFNGQYPGPLLRVAQDARIVVRFRNSIDMPSTIHWHGIRLENRFDGVPGVTQDAVPPGGEFIYEIVFPDAGVYWYHPHVREDIQQDGGLYGNLMADPTRRDYFGPATREEFIMVDDLLVDGDELLPYGQDAANFAIMGRFGNVMLVNGEERYAATVRRGEVVRFLITNVSSTRSYNLSFAGHDMKLVATDLSRFQREMMVESLVISPAERYIVEVRFAAAGTFALLNQVQAVDHMRGTFYAAVDTLGTVVVEGPPVAEAGTLSSSHSIMRTDAVLEAELAEFRPYFDRPVDRELLLTVDIKGLPILVQQFISIDTIYRPPVEWTDGMPNMNWLSTSNEVRWILRDQADGAENAEIDWRFRLGDIVKIRLRNDAHAFHPMHHPIHLHGQRFLVLSRDGTKNRNLAWKDTVLVPVGSTVDLLMEASNPGEWMIHCHIAEHMDAGMMGSFTVEGQMPP